MTDCIDRLKSFPMLESISDQDIEDFAGLLNTVKAPAGSDIITEGETGSEMFFLIKGRVDVIKTTVFGDSFVCASLNDEEHSVFGEMALIDAEDRSATVRAVTDCVALSVSRRDFIEYTDSHPKAGVLLLRFISMNLARNIRHENENLNLVYQALIEEIESA